MELWNWPDFWNEFTLPVLVASLLMWALLMIAKWAWVQNRHVVFSGVLWLVLVVLLGFMFTTLRPRTQIEVITDSGQTSRPYFTQTKADIQEVSQGSAALIVSVQNNNSPAQDVVSQLLVLEESLDPTREPIHTKRIENANDVGSSGTLSQYWFVDVKQNARPAFVVFEIRYTDFLRDERYSQALFLKFLGSSQDGTFIQQLSNATSDEKTRMEAYLRVRGIPRLLGD